MAGQKSPKIVGVDVGYSLETRRNPRLIRQQRETDEVQLCKLQRGQKLRGGMTGEKPCKNGRNCQWAQTETDLRARAIRCSRLMRRQREKHKQ
jgi:hypothetical protein